MGAILVTFQKVGGALVVSVPKEMARMLALRENQTATASVQDGKIVLELDKRVKATDSLDELLARCDLNAPLDPEGVEFMTMASVGREITE